MTRLLILMGVAAAACSGGARDSVTLSARLGSSGGQALLATDGGVQAASGIELSRVRISVRRLRLERKSDGSEVKISEGPLLLDVNGPALGGALVALVTAHVPPGTYDKLELDVHAVETSPSVAFDDLVERGASVLVEGSVDGKPFTFASGLEIELEQEGQFQLGAAAANITLDLDAATWFRAADGSRLNPLDPAAREAILANIRASFRAFEDDDQDGIEDEREHRDAGDDHGDGGSDDGSGHH